MVWTFYEVQSFMRFYPVVKEAFIFPVKRTLGDFARILKWINTYITNDLFSVLIYKSIISAFLSMFLYKLKYF